MNEVAHNLVEKKFTDFIIENDHPCIMANAIFQLKNYKLKVFDRLSSDSNVMSALVAIEDYVKHYDFHSNKFESLLLTFTETAFETEVEFENAMWHFLQKLNDLDDSPWDSTVSDDPMDKDFSFSVKGTAFYIIGMHPNSSRIARKAPYCTLVFNLHRQFELLREMGKYQTVKNRIRKRDKELQGFINPTLTDFGDDSESKQYSGRKVGKNWKCPFHHNK